MTNKLAEQLGITLQPFYCRTEDFTESEIRCIHNRCIPHDGLYVRTEGDNRPDTEIKKELFFAKVAPNYHVKIVVDDRPCMIRMWHSIKIPSVISVGDPYKEF